MFLFLKRLIVRIFFMKKLLFLFAAINCSSLISAGYDLDYGILSRENSSPANTKLSKKELRKRTQYNAASSSSEISKKSVISITTDELKELICKSMSALEYLCGKEIQKSELFAECSNEEKNARIEQLTQACFNPKNAVKILEQLNKIEDREKAVLEAMAMNLYRSCLQYSKNFGLTPQSVKQLTAPMVDWNPSYLSVAMTIHPEIGKVQFILKEIACGFALAAMIVKVLSPCGLIDKTCVPVAMMYTYLWIVSQMSLSLGVAPELMAKRGLPLLHKMCQLVRGGLIKATDKYGAQISEKVKTYVPFARQVQSIEDQLESHFAAQDYMTELGGMRELFESEEIL